MEKKDKDGNQTIMKIRRVCVDILHEIDHIYLDYMVAKGNQKVLYVHITQAIYGMLVSAMLFYHKLTKALLSYGFELNPYDLCGVNKMVNRSLAYHTLLGVLWQICKAWITYGMVRRTVQTISKLCGARK